MARIDRQKGAALIVVLLIVMTVTVVSLGFLWRSDVEMACGENMVLRTQMDYLAESGLQHARGLLVNPQDVGSEYWSGAVRQQLSADSGDYYDVAVTKLGECNYQITCDAYRENSGTETGRSSLRAELRLDPVIAFWAGSSTTILPGMTINGDVCCNGTLINCSTIGGDVFAAGLDGNILGQCKPLSQLSVTWPRVTVADFVSNYAVQPIGPVLSSTTLGPYEPVRVCHRPGNLELAGSVCVNGMLLVEGDLTIQGTENVITAAKNLPAFYVTGDVIVTEASSIDVFGLGVVEGNMEISAGGSMTNVVGSLFVKGLFGAKTADSTGNGHAGSICSAPTWRPAGGQTDGALEFDGVDDKVEDLEAGGYLNGLSALTVSLWAKADVTGHDGGLFFTREPTGADEELGLRYDMAGAFAKGTKGITASIQTTGGYTLVESTSNRQTTTWQHLALVWESGSSIELYINGQRDSLLHDQGPVGGTLSGAQKFMLGCGTKGQYWDGLIDDLRIYDRALDPNEIYPPTDGIAGLVTHWKLDETGSTVGVNAAPNKTAVVVWSETAARQNWNSAGGAFFRSIERP